MRREPFGFSTITSEIIHSVGSLIGLKIPILVILLTFAFNFFFYATGIFFGRIDHRRNGRINS